MSLVVVKAVTRGGVLGVKTPPKLFAISLVSQLCLFVQQNIFLLRLLNIGVCLNHLPNRNPCRHAQKTHHFEKNAKNFWGGDTPSPDPTPLVRLRRLDLRAYGAQAQQRDTSKKHPSYGLGRC